MTTENDVGQKEWSLAYRVALRVLRSPDLAADVAQDTLLRAFTGAEQYDIRNLQAWIRRVAYNTALGHLRSPWHRRRAGGVTEEDLARTPSPGAPPDERAAGRALSVCLDTCLHNLREADRWLLVEKYFNGASMREIAHGMGVSDGTARQRMFRARRRLRECVDENRCATHLWAEEPLADRRCRPCSGGVPPLSPRQVGAYLDALDRRWKVVDDHHLARRFELGDFSRALAFAQDVGRIADEEGHHPSLSIEGDAVRVELYTHKCDGMTEADFILAAKIDRLPAGS